MNNKNLFRVFKLLLYFSCALFFCVVFILTANAKPYDWVLSAILIFSFIVSVLLTSHTFIEIGQHYKE